MVHQQHPRSEEWADYVRGLASEEAAAILREHLSSGCQECEKTVRWLQAVVETVARIPAGEDPPDELVASAKAIFPQDPERMRSPVVQQLETIFAQLLTVSHEDWLPLGVRSGSVTGERRLYRAEDFVIDLSMDPAGAGGETGEIVGQIAQHRATGPSSLERVLVQLRSGGKVLGETETNPHGEFVLQRPILRTATLRFALPAYGKQIDLTIESRKGGNDG